jgi:ferredoxin-NADP reductase/DMSO/TMAO reductase YedYZ heme-binding membrane subunit
VTAIEPAEVADSRPARSALPRPHPTSYRGAAEAVIAAMVAGAALVTGWTVALAFAAPGPVQLAPLTAHVTGMLAGYVVVLLVVLMSRWPVLERGVGSDRLARWHATGGRTVLSLVVVHATAATIGWTQVTGLSPLGAALDVLGMPGLVAATVGTVLMVAAAVASVRVARRRLRYETWHGLHLTMYLAVALSFVHQLAGPDMAGRPAVQVAWALLYTHAFGLVLRYRVIQPLRSATRHRLRVAAVIPEADDVVSIVIEGAHVEELRAEPGQFFRWRFLTPDLWAATHPFSLSAPPTADRLRLTVKALGDGSRWLQDIEVGTWVVAEGPYGAMTAQRRTRRDVALIAGGVGITPMRALFETIPLTPQQDLVLLYRARTREELVFRDELTALAQERRARVIFLLGGDRELLSSSSLRRLVPNLIERDVYLCGSPGMASAVRASLADAGLPPNRLHEERFTF